MEAQVHRLDLLRLSFKKRQKKVLLIWPFVLATTSIENLFQVYVFGGFGAPPLENDVVANKFKAIFF